MTKVLIVDDDRSLARILRLTLASESIEVEEAYSGIEALDLLLNEHIDPDLILLDLAMPDMNGREVFRTTRLEGVTCPIVICSGHGATAANRELGGQGALNKPFDIEDVLEIVLGLTESEDDMREFGA